MTKPNDTMRAQVVRAFGPAETAFELIQVPVPQPDAHHMLIQVEASSVNPVDFKIRSGAYQALAPTAPTILHSDVAGTVVAVGKNVTQFKVGDKVYGCAGGFIGTQGALSEYMLVDADLMALCPTRLSMLECASLPLVAITAWEALIERAKIQPRQKVLIHAASGGVGSFALQLALWAGAKTYATASDEIKAQFAKERGATVINYKETSVEAYVEKHTEGRGFDVVLDTVGGDNLATSIQAIKTYGTVCAIAGCEHIDLRTLHRKNGTLHYIFMPQTLLDLDDRQARRHYGDILTKVASLVDEGYIKPLVGKVVNFSDIAEAHRLQERGAVIGKIALQQDLGR